MLRGRGGYNFFSIMGNTINVILFGGTFKLSPPLNYTMPSPYPSCDCRDVSNIFDTNRLTNLPRVYFTYQLSPINEVGLANSHLAMTPIVS